MGPAVRELFFRRPVCEKAAAESELGGASHLEGLHVAGVGPRGALAGSRLISRVRTPSPAPPNSRSLPKLAINPNYPIKGNAEPHSI
jgi:hypothetical protein